MARRRRFRRNKIVDLVVVALLAAAALYGVSLLPQDQVEGKATVLDGDSLRLEVVDDLHVRSATAARSDEPDPDRTRLDGEHWFIIAMASRVHRAMSQRCNSRRSGVSPAGPGRQCLVPAPLSDPPSLLTTSCVALAS